MPLPSRVRIRNVQTLPLERVPILDIGDFRKQAIASVGAGQRLSALFYAPDADGAAAGLLYAVLASDRTGNLSVCASPVPDAFPSLTPECPQAHWFEREIAEQWNVRPEGHPWLKPIRFHASYRKGSEPQIFPDSVIGVADFYRVQGEEIHEVAVGPVHAGIIEPGHFRFQCHGEDVFHLEVSLGYQHRGVEPALAGGPSKRTVHYMESLAGDTTIGHATAYAQAVEGLSGLHVSARAYALRAVALELERLANHTGDLGALAGDVGFLPTMSYCGRIRGDFLNMTAILCGNRFGRGFVRPGGVMPGVAEADVELLLQQLAQARKDVITAVELLWDSPSAMARFERTGVVSSADCIALGLVGPAARACGMEQDVRVDHPHGLYSFAHIPVAVCHSGDVMARALVRWLEIERSLSFVEERISHLPDEDEGESPGLALTPESLIVSLVEGWRGEICHVAITDQEGRFARYKVVDPSFHNWMGLAIALRNQQISDFPLCNKSFNLSYCGHDL